MKHRTLDFFYFNAIADCKNTLVQQGKSKKSKVKRKNSDAARFLPISNGILISAALY